MRLRVLIATLLWMCGCAMAQSNFQPGSSLIVQNNGTTLGFGNTINLVSGCTATQTGSTFALTCSGGPAVPVGVANGSQLVSNGTSQPPIYQAKPVLDVRDYGVTGNGSTDDTTAMQNALNAACPAEPSIGSKLIIPAGFAIKITSTLTITNCTGLTLDGQQTQGQGTVKAAGGAGAGNAVFMWYGAAHGTVFSLNQVRDSTFKNFTVFTNASNYTTTGADNALLIDTSGTITNITTNNLFDDIQIYNGNAANSAFIGISVCPTAPGNCEEQNFSRLLIQCGTTATASNTGIGIRYNSVGNTAQPFYESIRNTTSIGNCSRAIDIAANTKEVVIDGGLFEANYTDLYIEGGTDITFSHIRDEGTNSPIVIDNTSGGASPILTVEGNEFSGLIASTTTVSYSIAGNTGGLVRLVNNTWDVLSTVTPFGPTGGGSFTGVLESENNTYPNSANCISAAFATSGSMYSTLNDLPTGGTCNYQGFHIGRPNGVLQLTETTFTNLPTCASGTAGTIKAISDSTVGTWGSTIAGSGSNHVMAYCNGTNWLVMGGNQTGSGSFTTLALGTNPATTGILMLPNAGIIKARNAANSADFTMIEVDGSNGVDVGQGGAGPVYIDLFAGGASGGSVSLNIGNTSHQVGTDSGSAFCVSTDTCWWRDSTLGAGNFDFGSSTQYSKTGTLAFKRFNVDGGTTLTSGAFALSAGWGSTASIAITVTTSKDPAYVVTITTGGSGIVANPTLQITFADGTWTNVPVCRQIQTGGNDIFSDTTVTARSATSYTYQWNGTPTTGKTYELTQTCIGS